MHSLGEEKDEDFWKESLVERRPSSTKMRTIEAVSPEDEVDEGWNFSE